MNTNPKNKTAPQKTRLSWIFWFGIVSALIAVFIPFLLAFLLLGGISTNNIKDALQIEQSIFAIVAIIAAVAWYFQRRKRYPRANLTQEVIYKRISDQLILVRVTVAITNIGEVRLQINSGFCRILILDPAWDLDLENKIKDKTTNLYENGSTVINWPKLVPQLNLDKQVGFKEIEPGEIDEYVFDFIAHYDKDTKIGVIAAYTELTNEEKRKDEIKWQKTTLYDVEATTKEKDKSNG